MNNRIPGILALSLCAALSVRPAFADDLDRMRKLHQSTVDMVNQMLAQGLITRERADQILRQAQETAGPWAGGSPVPAPPAAAPSAADVTPGAPAAAAPPPAPEAPPAAPSTNDLLKALVESGAISKEKAFELQHDAQQKAATEIPATVSPEATPEQKAAAAAAPPAKPGDKSTVRVPYVPEIVKQQIRDQVKEEVLNQARRERWGDPGTLPAWITRLAWNGDIRLRYETDMFPTDGAPNASPQQFSNLPYVYNMNDTQSTRNRIRIRVRLGIEGQIDDHWSAGVRIASGGSGGGSNPANESQTLGDYDERFSVGLDRAYLRYKPFNWFSATAGRFGNPFYTPTDLVWAEAVSFDGFVTKFSGELNDKLDGALVTGAFPLLQQDNQTISPLGTKAFSRWLFGYQAGLHWQFAQRDDLKLAVAYYDFHRIEGIAAPADENNHLFNYDSTAAPFRQKGNQVFDIDAVPDNNSPAPTNIGLLSQFRELNVSGAVDLADYAPTHVILTGDFVRNLGFHAGEIENRTFITDPGELKARVEGYQFRLQVGADKVTNRGQWYGYAGYRHLERDAVVDAFTDPDFWLGGTNAKGYFVGGRYGVAKNTSVGARWMSGNQIDGPLPLAIDIVQLELLASF